MCRPSNCLPSNEAHHTGGAPRRTTRLTLLTLVMLAGTVAACGGGNNGANTPARTTTPPAAAKPDLDQLYAQCGLRTTVDVSKGSILAEALGDPSEQRPKHKRACIEFAQAAIAAKRSTDDFVAVADIAYALCFGHRHGHACRIKAWLGQLLFWTGEGNPADWDSEVKQWLGSGCDYGDAESCKILKSGKDSAGRVWRSAR